jgi:hypothetical protein
MTYINVTSAFRYVLELPCIPANLTSGLPSGSTFPVGVSTITYTATDNSGNSNTCSFTVTVTDSSPPVVTCPGNQTIQVGSNCQAVVPDYTSMVTVSDDCAGPSEITVTQTPAPGALVTADQVITVRATDPGGNVGSCSFILTLQDQTPPVITCQGNITLDSSPGACGSIANYTVPTVTDNCHGCAPTSLPGFTLIGEFGGHTYFRSPTVATWSAANSTAISLGAHLVTIGSAAEASFLSALGQNWIGFTDEVTEGVWQWANNEPVTYTNWAAGQPDNAGNQDYAVINTTGITWTDVNGTVTNPYIIEFDCAATLTPVVVSGPTPGSSIGTGTTTVTYQVTDSSGNTATCSFDITVNDVTAPEVNCPGNITVNNAPGQCNAAVTVPTIYNINTQPVTCGSIPAEGACGTGNGPATSGMTISAGQTFWYSSTGTFTSLNLFGGTLRVCGDLTLNNIFFSGGYIMVEEGGSLTINGTNALTLSGNSFIINRGTLTLNRSLTMQNGTNLCANASPYAVWNQDGGNYTLTINSTNSRFINLGTANIRRISMNGAAPESAVCMGYNSTLVVTGITNSSSNTINAINGHACLNLLGAASLNSVLSNTPGLFVCRDAASSVSGPGGWGAAQVSLNCTSCSYGPGASDNCDIASITNDFNGTSNASGTYPVGTTTVTWTVSDPSGNTGTCTTTVTVNDTEAPVIICPGNMTVPNDPGECGATVSYSVTATDNCANPLIVQNSGPASGSFYPLGTTTHSFTATDAAGNSSTCSFTITVTDTEDPVALCQDITVPLSAPPVLPDASISGVINYYSGVSSVTGSSVVVAAPSGFSPGDKVLLIQMQGATVNTTNTSSFGTITSEGNAGNYEFLRISSISGNTVNFSTPVVRVYDAAGRVQLVRIPEYNDVTVTGAVTAAPWNGSTGGVVAFDAAGTITMNAPVSASGAGFRGGSVSNNFYVNCANNANFAFAWPSNNGGQKGEGIAISAAAQGAGRGRIANGGGAGNEVNAGGAGGGNGGAGGTGGNEWNTCNNPYGGINGNSLSAYLSSGKIFMGGGGGGGHQNDSQASAGGNGGGIVILNAPVLISNGQAITAQGSNANNATNDGGGGAGAGGTILLHIDSFNDLTAAQANGGSGANCSVNHGPGGGGGGGVVLHKGSTVPANLSASVNGGQRGTAAGNARGTTVGSAGVISGNLLLQPNSTFTTVLPSAVDNGSTDNCGIASISLSPNAFTCSNLGPNNVTLTVTDASGNSSSCAAIITVVDDIPPTLTCPADISQSNAPGLCGANVTVPVPLADDNCSIVSLVNSFNNTSDASGFYPIGNTTVTWTVTDSGGNTVSCSMTVTVTDNEIPAVTCPGDQTIATQSGCAAPLPDYTAIVAATDNCPGLSVVQNPTAGTPISSTTSVTVTATDQSGNISTCTFNVIPTDQTDPTITCPGDQNVAFSASCDFVLADYTALAVTADNCGPITVTQSPAAGSTFVAATTVTLTATDGAGNDSSCSFDVIPTDQTDPTITCPGDQTVAFSATVTSCSQIIPHWP